MRSSTHPLRLARRQQQLERRLPMRCDITRNTPGAEIAPGYAAPYAYEIPPDDPETGLSFSNIPCYVWNLLYLLQGEFVFAEREYVQGQLRALLPSGYGSLLTEQDQIGNITLNGEVKFAGPLNIYLVVPHSLQTLLVLRGAH